MKLPANQSLYAYWDRQRQGRCAPRRQDLDPAEMRSVLPYTFMLEVDDFLTSYPVRISGTRLDAVFGRDLKGCNFLDLWAGAGRDEVRAMLGDVLDGARPAVAGVLGAPAGYEQAGFELLVLPIRHQGRTHARLLCALAPHATPGWIGLRAVSQLALSSWRMIEPVADASPLRGRLRRDQVVVYEGGRSGDPAPLSPPQSRVKTGVSKSDHVILLTRRS